MDKKRKLRLAKETLRVLALKEIAEVAGGSNQVKCIPTTGGGTNYTCASNGAICCA